MNSITNDWYKIKNIESIDSPSLLFYEENIIENIKTLLSIVPANKLRPHIKTSKCGDIVSMFLKNKITKIKTSNISETLIAAKKGMPDILLAHQPTKLKAIKLFKLKKQFPKILFSTIIDNFDTAQLLDNLSKKNNTKLSIFIDINSGMNRTGVVLGNDLAILINKISNCKNLNIIGFHVYDGHLKNKDEKERNKSCFSTLNDLKKILNSIYNNLDKFEFACGGSNTFPFYAKQNVICCPGTFIFWDINYTENLPEQNFKIAAILLGRVISKPSENYFCIDIGYKSVASENILINRIKILNYPKLIPISQSEEHFVFYSEEKININIGEEIYASPFHICPTVALYQSASLIINQKKIKKIKLFTNRI